MPFSLENLMTAVIYLGVIVLIALVVQALFHWRLIQGEYSRKLTHICTALWMATWQFTLTHLEITYLCIALIYAIIFAKQFKWFNSVFEVDRATYGEVLFITGVMATALIFNDYPAVYALAIVNLGLADGMAAIIGTKYGRTKYEVFGSTKSIIGMLTSFAVAILTGAVFWYLAFDLHPNILLMATHVIATAAVISGLEFVSCAGLDNLTIPLVTGLLYSNLIF